MTTRADLIEDAAVVTRRDHVMASAIRRAKPEDAAQIAANWAREIRRQVLPQVTTVEQLEALPAGVQWRSANGYIGTWTGEEICYLSRDRRPRVNVLPITYLEGSARVEFPLTVVWQPSADRVTT